MASEDLPTPAEVAAEFVVPEVVAVPGPVFEPIFKGLGSRSTDNTYRAQDMGLGPQITPSSNGHSNGNSADPKTQPSPFTEIGASGLAQYGGFVRDEFLPQLQGDKGLRVFREMYDNDPIVGALVFAVQMLMRKVEWRVEPPESPTVEGIVESRQKQRMQLLADRQADKQAQLMTAQAGLAGKSQGGPGGTGKGPAGSSPAPPPPQPTPSHAAPIASTVPFHAPLPDLGAHKPGEGAPAPQAAPDKAPSPVSPTAPFHSPINSPGSETGTPDNRPGANAPNAVTRPGSNYPAAPNSPGSNPGGGPNQSGALGGRDGLPGARPITRPGVLDAKNDVSTGGMPKKPLTPIRKDVTFDSWWEEVNKAGGSGSQAGGIQALDVGSVPLDPETGEPMDFPIGTGPLDPPSPEERHAMELAVFVETALHDMADSWSDTISQIITMIVYGFALHEIVYKKRNGPNPDEPVQGSRFADGRIGWAKVAGRAQETRHRWEFDEFGNVLGMWQLAPPKFQLKYIPMAKSLLFRTTGYKQNPEGRSILRSAYRPWYFKRRIEEIEAIGVERNLAGLPVCYVPAQWMTSFATPNEKASLDEVKKIVRNVRQDEQGALVLPAIFDPETKQQLFKFELMSSASTKSNFDTDKIITRYDQRIAMVALVDFILLGHESVGSKALADTKADLFTTALESWLTVIADVFNTMAIPRLMQINGEDPAMSPRLAFGKLTRISLIEISALITSLAQAGADLFPDNALEDHIRGAAGLPPKEASDDL